MEGVPIRYQKLVVVHQCCTDANRHFSFGRRRSKVRYYAKWRRDDFHIRGLGKVFAVAETSLSGNTKRQIDVTLDNPDHAAWKYASVFRAAHTYYYKHSELGLSNPGDRNLCIRLSCRTPDKRGEFRNFHFPGSSEVVVYYHKLAKSLDFFCTTFHEIGHSTHFNWDKTDYRKTSTKVKESWARGVENYASNKVYGDHRKEYDNEYTGIVMDLIDNDSKVGETLKPDNVSGITISEIERSLRGATSWSKWRDNIKNTENGKRQQKQIDELFQTWSY